MNYFTLFKCYPSTIQVCRSFKSFSSIHHNQLRLVFKETKNCVINRKFHLTKFHQTNKTAGDNVKVSKVKLRTSDFKRLLSLAKPEKWAIIGRYNFD